MRAKMLIFQPFSDMSRFGLLNSEHTFR